MKNTTEYYQPTTEETPETKETEKMRILRREEVEEKLIQGSIMMVSMKMLENREGLSKVLQKKWA